MNLPKSTFFRPSQNLYQTSSINPQTDSSLKPSGRRVNGYPIPGQELLVGLSDESWYLVIGSILVIGFIFVKAAKK